MKPLDRLGDPVAFLGLGLGSPGHDLDRYRVVDGASPLCRYPGMERANAAAFSTMRERLRRFSVIVKVRTPRVAVRELRDVADIGTTPLVDGLIVVADYTKLDLAADQQPDQALLGGVDILVLVDNQVASVACAIPATAGVSSSATAREISSP